MRGQEVNDTLNLAMELVMFGVLCVLVVFFTTLSRNLYSLQEEQEVVQEDLQEQGRNYFFNYADHIYGSDIIEFIIKYDESYDYYIDLKGSDEDEIIEITREYAQVHEQDLKDKGYDSDSLWSQEYLTNIVFVDTVFSEFTVNAVQDNYSTDYYITEK
ncbi:MAG: hypothetical protein K0R34_681 [Herbinix sp.]|jgi:hypothetical protein|nr:hypothetical protein [Herbinix sp.]